MTEIDAPPELRIDEILHKIRTNFYPSSEAQIGELILALSNLNGNFLYYPDSIPKNLNEFLLPIFENPPNNKIMGLCAKCIVKALTADKPNGIEPSNFPFSAVVAYIKSQNYSQDTIIDLLEIIFTIVNIENSDSERQINEIANSDSNDIDIFFNYYNCFADSSKISCLKCIKNIVKWKVFDRFVIFLPNLLDIALSNYENKSHTLYDMAIKTFVIMSKYYLKKDIIKIDKDNQFDPAKYCDQLCNLTAKYTRLKYLDVFIDSVRLCIHSFNFTIPTVLKRIRFVSFFENVEETSILEAAIKLILALMPYPSDKLTYIQQTKFNLNFADSYQNGDSSYAFELNRAVQEVVPYICKIYYTNISLSLLCIQAMTIFANTDKIILKLSNRVLFMMHFHLTDPQYVPYILSIISQCMKSNDNKEPIIQSRIIERLSSNIELNRPEDQIYNFYKRSMEELNLNSQKSNLEVDFKNLDINQLSAMIEGNKLSPFDLLIIYCQLPNKNLNCFKSIRKMITNAKHFDQIEDQCQVIVDLLLRMLADIPIPLLCSDPYYGKYNRMLDDEITLTNESGSSTKKVSFNSLLSEYDGETQPPNIDNLLSSDKNNQITQLFNLEDILSHNNTYLYDILERELGNNSKRQQYKINNIAINDPDQYIITILPQIISHYLDDLTNNKNLNERIDLSQIIHKQFNIKIDYTNEKVSKRFDFKCKVKLMKNQEIVQEILDILEFIYIKDRGHALNYIYKPFLDNILEQLKYLFLLMGLYSPCSQLMVKYPFLFNLNERNFLMQLLVKEPFMAKELFLKDYPNHERKKVPPRALVKFTLHRDNIFKEGILILERFAKYRAFLDISFHGEKGFGDGPTREFFNLMSREFCEKRHRIWRRNYSNTYEKDESEKELLKKLYANNDQGLFPYATANKRYMKALGLFIAKAIQMEQIIDIPLNPAFFDLAAGREVSLSSVDLELAQNLDTYGFEVVDGFTFTYTIEKNEYPIVKNGENINVTEDNFEIYKKALTEFICGKYVKKKIDYFVSGFAEVLDPIILGMFSGKEMLSILDGNRDLLTAKSLSQFIKCENGYDQNSQEIQNFIDIVSNLDFENQKCFIQFVTGSPFLPFGGLAALDPPITVAMRTSNPINPHDDQHVDHQLPTASTCFNRLKLPPYTSKKAMKEKIIKAITEGNGSFDLS